MIKRKKNTKIISLVVAICLLFTIAAPVVSAVDINGEENIDIDDGLKNYWDFENVSGGDTNIPSNNEASVIGNLVGSNVSIANSESVFGNVLRFNQDNNSYMKIDNYINTGNQDTSFSMWLRYDTSLDSSSTSAVLLQQSGNGRSLLTLRPNGQYHTYINAEDVISNQTSTKDTWQHVSVTFDQTNRKAKFYINGKLDSEKAMGSSSINAVTNLLIGTHKNIGNTDPHTMRGDIDEIRVYEKVLSDEEALAIYAQKGAQLEKEDLKIILEEATTLYESKALNDTHTIALALRDAINEGTTTLGNDSATLANVKSSIAQLNTAISNYQNNIQLSLDISASSERTIESDSIFGINHRYAFNGYGSFDQETMKVKEEFKELYTEAGFGSIRYPGGTISNLFNWKTAIGPVETRKNQIHGFYNNAGQGGIAPNFGIDELGEFAQSVDSEIVYVYSLGRGNSQDAEDLIEYLNAEVGTNPNGGIDWAQVRSANGHVEPYNVRYFEIGNEMQQAYAGSDGTASQGYWTTSVTGGSETAYIDGGNASFTKQYAVCEEDWNKSTSISDGTANMKRYMRYANVNPKTYDNQENIVDDETFVAVNKGSVSVFVGNDSSNEQWTIVDNFNNSSSSDKHVVIDYSTGALVFGDGLNGAIPAKGQQIYVTYSVERDGFIDVSKAIKETMEVIDEKEGRTDVANVYTGYESQGFITKMTARDADKWYDGMTIHPYSGTPTGSTADAWYDSAMKLAENAGVAHVKNYVAMLPEGKVPVISEYGIFRDTNTLVRSQSNALYSAKVLMEYVRLGSPYIQKHCLVDWYSSGADSLGPTQQATIQAVAQDGSNTATGEGKFAFFSTPTAKMFSMLNSGFGNEILESSISNRPTMSNGVQAISTLISKDSDGNVYIAIVNVDRENDCEIKISVDGVDLDGKKIEVQTLDAAIDAENTLDNQNNVDVATSSFVADGEVSHKFTAHSFTILKINVKEDTSELENAKEELAEEIKKLEILDDSAYTPNSYGKMKKVLIDAKIVLENPSTALAELKEAIEILKTAYNALVKVADTSALQTLITEVEKLDADKYSEDSYTMVVTALASAKAVLADKNETQAEIDAMTLKLQSAASGLKDKPVDPDPDTDLDTSLLEFMITEADKQVEDGALVGVIEAVVERFNKALKEAKDMLVKADIDPTSVTQAEIDLATKNLIDALHMLDFKGTKGLLQNLVAKCERYVADKALYSKATYDVFEAALEEAKTVLADKTAFQDEIDKAWFDLATGLAGLRKIPNKDALKGLLDKARSIDSSQYTVASFRVLADTVDDANIVLGDTNATVEAVVSSEKAVKTAMDGLVPLATTPTDGTATEGTSTTTKASDSDKVVKVADTTTKAATSVPKTGENSLAMLLFIMLSLSCVVTVVIRKKKVK